MLWHKGKEYNKRNRGHDDSVTVKGRKKNYEDESDAKGKTELRNL